MRALHKPPREEGAVGEGARRSRAPSGDVRTPQPIGDDYAHRTRLRLMFSRRWSRWLQRQVQDVADIAARAQHLKRPRVASCSGAPGPRGHQAAKSHVCPLSPAAVVLDLASPHEGSASRARPRCRVRAAGAPEAPAPAPEHVRRTREDLVETIPQELAHDSSPTNRSRLGRPYAHVGGVVSTKELSPERILNLEGRLGAIGKKLYPVEAANNSCSCRPTRQDVNTGALFSLLLRCKSSYHIDIAATSAAHEPAGSCGPRCAAGSRTLHDYND
eukprot:7377532-Prymnesium_polylepis.2